MSRPILLCTVGTSLFGNLKSLRGSLTSQRPLVRPEHFPTARRLADARDAADWNKVSEIMGELPADEFVCGAEVNSIASLCKHAYAPPDAGVFFFHSDTPDGRTIADVLVRLFRARGHSPVAAVPVPDLQDEDAKRFRTKGLRNLAKLLCAKVREFTAASCAINATGGYKAQIAVAVLLGQALGIPVYYMHERFSEIIAFPPMPVSLDFEVWMRASGLLSALAAATDPVPAARLSDEWDERYESLVDRVTIDGTDYLELSPTGQIFHETFRERFRTDRDRVLPPPAEPGRKREPSLGDHGVINALRAELVRFLAAVTADVPQVVHCHTTYCNPDLPETTRFRERGGQIEGVHSDGSATVKFVVETTAATPGQRAAVVAALNDWLDRRR